ncbi:MAG: hypothetical protein WDZ80_02425 [Candidatus Paceibacterota bacterium]
MIEFLNETLKPEVFWTAVAAFLAVLVALFSSSISKWKENRRIVKLIEAELRGNVLIIRNMRSREPRRLTKDIKVSPAENNDALRTHIDLRLWHKFRYSLAASNPKKYKKYQEINRYAEAIVKTTMDPPEMRMMLQIDAAKNFVEKYEKKFERIDR